MREWGAQLSGFAELPAILRGAVNEGVQAGLESLGIEGERLVRNYIETPYMGKPPAVAFGNLERAITSTFQELPDMAREIIGAAPTLKASTYAAPVETGARPHFPPTAALIPWVKLKFGIEDEKQAASVAFAVARRISQRGTRGHLMFERALADLEPKAVPVLEREIGLSLARHGFTEMGGAL